jgi:transcriptional regulator with XRE-family HTH domain
VIVERVIVERLAARLADRPHATVAATVLVTRGRSLLDQRAFAELLGVSIGHLRSWESGARPGQHVPRRLASLAPELDWEAAGVREPGDPRDLASRHPSAHRRRWEQTGAHG